MQSPEVEPGGTETVVRAPRAEDAVEMARLAGELGYPTSTEQMRARLAWIGSLPGHWTAVAADDSEAVLGWIHLGRCVTLESGEFIEIFGLVVSNAARRGGVGRRLVRAAEDWTRAAGLERIILRSNVVRAEAHHFYPSIGYQRIKSQHMYEKRLA